MDNKSVARLHIYSIEYENDSTGKVYFGDRLLGELNKGRLVGVYNEGHYVDMLRRDLGKVLSLMGKSFPDIEFPKLYASEDMALLSMFRIIYNLDKMREYATKVFQDGKYYYVVAEGLLWGKPSFRYGVVDTDDYQTADAEMRNVLLDSDESRWFACAVFDEPFDFNISFEDIVHLYDN